MLHRTRLTAICLSQVLEEDFDRSSLYHTIYFLNPPSHQLPITPQPDGSKPYLYMPPDGNVLPQCGLTMWASLQVPSAIAVVAFGSYHRYCLRALHRRRSVVGHVWRCFNQLLRGRSASCGSTCRPDH